MLQINAPEKTCAIAGTDIVLHEGDVISIDGSTGNVYAGEAKLVRPELGGDLQTILDWADEIRFDEERGRVMGVRANADNPDDAALSRENGAVGIGLCRTEHMFLGERKYLIQNFILADDPAVKADALAKLGEAQKGDFLGMFKAMEGLPVIVRLLDPPLHEFLDSPRELEVEIAKLEAASKAIEAAAVSDDTLLALNEELEKALAVKQALLKQLDSFQEANPMLGTRGCRLGFLYPELNHMQFRAICAAAAELIKEGVDAKPEIMIPLVAFSEELKHLRRLCEEDIKAVSEEYGVKLEIPIGTMIELPRAAITADHIAKYADFYSFGTNDLTQTCLGFSRDDVESSFLDTYMNEKLIKTNPFATLDRGVARLVQMGVEGGKSTNPNIVCGVCGETGGDPESIQKYYDLGLDYVSCSPFRVPIARLAAAQAKIKSNGGAKKLA
jgi:pyruvate,orthophosphate dikinase